MTCPAGFSGDVSFGCANGDLAYLSGQCHPNCKAQAWNASARQLRTPEARHKLKEMPYTRRETCLILQMC